jgi:uncharacterized membrane protein YccC
MSPAIPTATKSLHPAAEALWNGLRQVGAAASPRLADPAIRNGIKFALAGTLALFFALWLRLDKPEWAVSTAFVLSTPKFVGAIGEKTVLRIVGAIAGAMLGYVIVGSLEQSPLLFLLAIGSLVAFGTAMYGGTLAPYGFRQCAYTATLVAAQGFADPAASWQVGLARCEEICLGILVTVPVTTILWPRYARKEFSDEVRRTLHGLKGLFRQRADAFLSGQSLPVPDVLGTIGARLAKLQKMIRLGCMESVAFRQRRPRVDAAVSQLGILSTALSNFGRTLPAQSRFRDYFEAELVALHAALATALETLADPTATNASRRASLDVARDRLRAYEARLDAFRFDGAGEHLSVDESLEHSGYWLSLHEIFDALSELIVLLPEVEAAQVGGLSLIRFEKFTPPSIEWIKGGLRGGLAVVAALFLVNWLKPPGGELVVVGAYLLTGFSLEATDRKGDLGVFDTLAGVAAVCLALFCFLLVAAPLMADYAVMNVVLAGWLFATGYLHEKGALASFTTLVSLLITVILVSLNAQHPVSFQGLVDPLLGLVLAATLAAFLRRLVWPALPQHAFRARLASLLGLLEKIASHPEKAVAVADRARLALSAADALVLIGVLDGRVIAAEEAGRLRAYVRNLARLGGHLVASTGLPPPTIADPDYATNRNALLAAISTQLAAQRHAVETGHRPTELPPAGRDVRAWTTTCRTRIRATDTNVPTRVASLALLYRHEQSALVADEAASLAATLDFRADFADTRL